MTSSLIVEQMAGRVPPHDLDAERALLGALLLSRDAIAAAAEVVPGADVFYRPAHAHIYEAITVLTGKGEVADPITVADELRRRDLLDPAGGTAALVELQTDAPGTAAAAHYARIVRDHARRRRTMVAAERVRTAAAHGAGIDDALEALEAAHDRPQVSSWAPVDLAEVLAGVDEVSAPTMLRRVDGHGLVYSGRLGAFVGEPETLKTWAADVAVAEVVAHGGAVMWLDLEDVPGTVTGRLRALGLPAPSIARGVTYIRPDVPATPTLLTGLARRYAPALVSWTQ